MPGPDFIGLGAQKTGTSWIYACLYDHPQICIPQKEIHFFSREHNWSQGTQWYERAFSSCDARVKGEFSPSYLYDGGTAERIHRLYPSAKLIASLRNPVDRAISHHLNDIKAGIVAPDVPFTTALAARPEYVDRGRYARQLEPYLQRFDRTQILILVYEDIRRDPLQFLRTVYLSRCRRVVRPVPSASDRQRGPGTAVRGSRTGAQSIGRFAAPDGFRSARLARQAIRTSEKHPSTKPPLICRRPRAFRRSAPAVLPRSSRGHRPARNASREIAAVAPGVNLVRLVDTPC